MASTSVTLDSFPTVPLRDMVIFSSGSALFVGTESSISALDAAMTSDKSAISSKA